MNAIICWKRCETTSGVSIRTLYLATIFACGIGWLFGIATSNSTRELHLYAYPSDYTITKTKNEINQLYNHTIRFDDGASTKPSTNSTERYHDNSNHNQPNHAPQTSSKPHLASDALNGSITNEENSQQPPATSIRKKPYFVLHVGPQKTGTSSLQHSFYTMTQSGMLERDNWHYTSMNHTFSDGQMNLTDRLYTIPIKSPDFWEMFQTEVTKLRASHKNILLSKEGYSVIFNNYTHYEELRNVLGDDWEVLIVVGYRPYYEWVISYWWQVNKRNNYERGHGKMKMTIFERFHQ